MQDLYCSSISTIVIPPLSQKLHLLQYLDCCHTSFGRGLPLLCPHFQCHRTTTIAGTPMLQDLYCLGLALLQYLHCHSYSIISGPPLSQPHIHCLRTSTIAGTAMWQDLYSYRTSTDAVSPMLQDLHCCRTSTVSA